MSSGACGSRGTAQPFQERMAQRPWGLVRRSCVRTAPGTELTVSPEAKWEPRWLGNGWRVSCGFLCWNVSSVVRLRGGGPSGHRGLTSRRDKVSSWDPESVLLRALLKKDGVAPPSLCLPDLPLTSPSCTHHEIFTRTQQKPALCP